MTKLINKQFDKKVLIPIFFTVFSILPILAPVLARFGINSISEFIYTAFQFFCHQRPWRSIHLFDYQIAVCARDLFMYFGITITTWLVYFKRHEISIKDRYAFFLIIFFMIPMALDGGIQLLKEISQHNVFEMISETTNLAREITGLICGIGVGLGAAFVVLTDHNSEYLNLKRSIQTMFAFTMKSILIGIVLIPLSTVIWYMSSFKYRPSSLFLDTQPNYPGYNYEITTNLGHGIGNRIKFLTEPIDVYCLRAAKYELNEFESKCKSN